jgi:hypothetical protein
MRLRRAGLRRPSSISFSAKDLPPTVHPRFPDGMIRVILNPNVASAVAVAWIAEAKMVPDTQPVPDRPRKLNSSGQSVGSEAYPKKVSKKAA